MECGAKSISDCLNCPYPDCINDREPSAGGTARRGRKGREVEQYSMDGRYIKTWGSVAEAAYSVSGVSSSIIGCCRGKAGSYKGYIWKYKPRWQKEESGHD